MATDLGDHGAWKSSSSSLEHAVDPSESSRHRIRRHSARPSRARSLVTSTGQVHRRSLRAAASCLRRHRACLSERNLHLLSACTLSSQRERHSSPASGYHPPLFPNQVLLGTKYVAKSSQPQPHRIASAGVQPRLKPLLFFLLEKEASREKLSHTSLSALTLHTILTHPHHSLSHLIMMLMMTEGLSQKAYK